MSSYVLFVQLCFLNNPWQVSDALARVPEGCPEPGSRQHHGRQSCRSSCFWWWSFVRLSLNDRGQPSQQYWKSALIPNLWNYANLYFHNLQTNSCKTMSPRTTAQAIFQQLLPTKNPWNFVSQEALHKIHVLQPEWGAHRLNGHDAFDTSCLSSKAHFDIAWSKTSGAINHDNYNSKAVSSCNNYQLFAVFLYTYILNYYHYHWYIYIYISIYLSIYYIYICIYQSNHWRPALHPSCWQKTID